MKSLYESILDTDNDIEKYGEQADLYKLALAIDEVMSKHNFSISSIHPSADFNYVFGGCKCSSMRDAIVLMYALNKKLSDTFRENTKFSQTAFQIYVDFKYKNQDIDCRFYVHNEKFNIRLEMNIITKDKNTCKLIEKIFNQIIPF